MIIVGYYNVIRIREGKGQQHMYGDVASDHPQPCDREAYIIVLIY